MAIRNARIVTVNKKNEIVKRGIIPIERKRINDIISAGDAAGVSSADEVIDASVLKTIPECGHRLHEGKPDEVNNAISNFLTVPNGRVE